MGLEAGILESKVLALDSKMSQVTNYPPEYKTRNQAAIALATHRPIRI